MTPPSQDPTLFSTLIAFLDGLPSPQPPYCLIGGLAQGVWGTIRATQDGDFLMAPDDEHRRSMIVALASHGFALDSPLGGIEPDAARYRDPVPPWTIPCGCAGTRDAHERESLGRRWLIQLDTLSVWVASPEDIILLKRNPDYS